MSQKHTNALASESSPYLLQHAHNPVNWVPWREAFLQKAQQENKLLIISIGYAACHWCHVMERESFEDETVAALMNEHFVCIKVDREERPDIDQIYMTACQMLNGNGGWPLNALALPNGQAFYAGTYFPKEKWLQILQFFVDVQQQNPEKIQQQAVRITQGIREIDWIKPKTETPLFGIEDLDTLFEKWLPKIDFTYGGNGYAPKFPMPDNGRFLLRYYLLRQNEKALTAVETQLRQMAWGGIYDHLRGGFARYATDNTWLVPHFEKMLYDNAQLVSLYAEAYRFSKNELYRKVIEETLDFVAAEMTDENGAFFAAIDADSEGQEGKFYVWKATEIDAILGEDAPIFKAFYNVKNEGNWEYSNILHQTESLQDFASKHGKTAEALQSILTNAKSRLLQVRNQRVRPLTDTKILCAWNALMLEAYVEAYRTLQRPEYLAIAIKNADFVCENMLESSGQLWRNFAPKNKAIPAFLDDYAFLGNALVHLYQCTFAEKYLLIARKITEYVLTHFYNADGQNFFYTADNTPQLIARKIETDDNVVPSSNSAMAKLLFMLGHFFSENKYINIAEKMLYNYREKIIASGAYYANWAMLYYWQLSPLYECAIVGENAQALRAQADEAKFLPQVFFMGSSEDQSNLENLQYKFVSGETNIYVCQQENCLAPVKTVAEALAELRFW